MNYDKINLEEYLNIADGDQEVYDSLMTETIYLFEMIQKKYEFAMKKCNYSLVQLDCHNIRPVLEMLKIKDLAKALAEGKVLMNDPSDKSELRQQNISLVNDMVQAVLAQLEFAKKLF
ncbi:MAG: hypothetical protein EAZ97_07725 [Bacteroidetes bacterium]|nr:MAG: hypothetical protein EAZ97_07725 [Bacteroidota bacterium]